MPSPIDTAAALEREVRQGVAIWAGATFRGAATELASAALIHAVAADRRHTAEVLALLQTRGEALAAAMTLAVHEALDQAGREPAEPIAAAPQAASLSLIDESQIDEDIAIARIIQTLEAEAEWELRELASLCSGLAQRSQVVLDANPIGAALCARALRRSLEGFTLSPAARLMLLREAGTAMGKALKRTYADLAEQLRRAGVRPARFEVRQGIASAARSAPGDAARVAPASAAAQALKGGPSQERRVHATVALAHLVERARRLTDRLAAAEAETAGPAMPALQLLSEPVPVGSARAASLDGRAAVRVMSQLVEHLLRQPSLSTAARDLLRRLDMPARRIAAAEPQLWSDTDHPWWRLLDRIVALDAVSDVAARDATAAPSLAEVVRRLGEAEVVDRHACQTALHGADDFASRLLGTRQERVVTEVGALQTQADRAEIEAGLRNQIVEQLRSTPAAPALQQFLLGPWTLAMTELAQRQGLGSQPVGELGMLAEDLIGACAHAGRAVSASRQRALLNKARTALVSGGLGPDRVEAELKDLAALLACPVGVDADPAGFTSMAPDGAAPTDLMGYAGLPTVPIDMVDSGELTEAGRDRNAWLDALQPGVCCRMFLQGRWVNTQLTWVSDNRNLYVFASRHAGRTHSMTRRVLERLRGAGLAATIEPGLLLAQAMDTLFDEASEPRAG